MNSEVLRVGAYLLVAAACFAAGQAEMRSARSDRSLWPMLWILTAGLLAGFAVARAVGVPELIIEAGRAEAHAGGIYEGRRVLQAAVVTVMAVAWIAAVLTALLRAPDRWRRYLPAISIVMSIVCFAAIRLVSLHAIDQLLYNHPIYGTRAVVFVELGLLSALCMLAVLACMSLRPALRRPAL